MVSRDLFAERRRWCCKHSGSPHISSCGSSSVESDAHRGYQHLFMLGASVLKSFGNGLSFFPRCLVCFLQRREAAEFFTNLFSHDTCFVLLRS